MRQIFGDASLANKIGERLRCIKGPDISYWTTRTPKSTKFSIPEVGKIYHLHSHVKTSYDFTGPYQRGITVSIKTPSGLLVPLENKIIIHNGYLLGEPFFAYDCFMVLSSQP